MVRGDRFADLSKIKDCRLILTNHVNSKWETIWEEERLRCQTSVVRSCWAFCFCLLRG